MRAALAAPVQGRFFSAAAEAEEVRGPRPPQKLMRARTHTNPNNTEEHDGALGSLVALENASYSAWVLTLLSARCQDLGLHPDIQLTSSSLAHTYTHRRSWNLHAFKSNEPITMLGQCD
jgi:hypothetical protein